LTDIPLNADLGTGNDRASGGRADDTIHGGDGDDEILLDGLGFATDAGGADHGFGDAGTTPSTAAAAPTRSRAARAQTPSVAVPASTCSRARRARTSSRPVPAPTRSTAAKATTR
jgi:hypothetical protein